MKMLSPQRNCDSVSLATMPCGRLVASWLSSVQYTFV